jgi:hypothetical protein
MNNTNELGSRSIRSWLVALLAAAFVAACGQDDDLTRQTENPDDMVDPALVGFWEMPVPGGRWTLQIESYGHYEFSNVSGSAAPSHQGTLAARGGKWLLRSVSGIEDTGTYEVRDDGIELTGNRGSVRWARGVAITGVTPGVDAGASFAPPQPPAFGAGLQQQPAFGGAAQQQPAFGGAQQQQPAFSPNVQRPVFANTNPPPRQVTAPPPAASVTAARPATSAARTSGGKIPDIVDPCLLVTADEVGQLFGGAATTKRTTPQPLTQNNCEYRGSGGQFFGVISYNGKGLDANGLMDRREKEGAVPIAGIGDRAVQSYREATGLVGVDFVIGNTSVAMTAAGVEPNRAQAAMIDLARQAAQRLTSTSSAYDMGGLDRFVGAWRVVTHTPNGRTDTPDGILIVQRDGTVDFETSAIGGGTLELDGVNWHFANIVSIGQPPHGTYRLSGDSLMIGGEVLEAQLERVACGKQPKDVRPPYELARTLSGQMEPSTKRKAPVRAPASKTLDKRLIGLWEGRGRLAPDGVPTQVLMSVDSLGWTVLALFPYGHGRLQAENGQYTLNLEGQPSSSGTYSLAGGISDGIIRMQEGENTLELIPTDPAKRPVYDTPIVAHCD